MTSAGKTIVAGLLGAVTLGGAAEAVTLEVSYTALERMIVRRIMTQEGRYYMEGDLSSTCRWAFVQEPRVGAAGERLKITVLFSGRAGAEVAGRCVGAGDNLDLEITGIPTYSNGEFLLSDLEIRAPDTAYFKLVAPLVERSLREKMRYPVDQELRRAAAWVASTTGTEGMTLGTLRVESIAVGEKSLRMRFDIDVSIGIKREAPGGR